MSLSVALEISDRARRRAAIDRLKQIGGFLPTWSELADPTTAVNGRAPDLGRVDPDAPDVANLWRVHWFNGPDRKSRLDVPMHVVLPPELTGVKAPIVVLVGRNFPMIGAHKVLAAYACLVPRLITGSFDPSHQRAIWPSTGNYCRGGVAISRILGCRGVAVLPAGMSRERFDWLAQWVGDPSDIIRTPGTESNVKEIYDKCAELERDKDNVIFNQFSEFANYLIHYHCTGQALVASSNIYSPATTITGSPRSCLQPARPARSRPATGLRKITAVKSSPWKPPNVRPCIATATASTTSRGSATSTSRSSIM